MKMEISLQESLCGFKRDIRTLESGANPLKLLVQPGEVIKDQMMYTIKGHGFPTYRNPYERGNLHIQFTVNYPGKFTGVSITPRKWVPITPITRRFCRYFYLAINRVIDQ